MAECNITYQRRPKCPQYISTTNSKKCSKCGQIKSIDQFYKDARTSDGLYSCCNDCHQKQISRWRKTPKGKTANYRCVQRHVKKHPQRARCHWRFSKAIKRGKIIRPTICSLCWLQNGTVEGHHPDYSKPLKVIWLCRKCHRRIAV